jgi:PIN domain nuclease of toxin-antitoxin system
LILPEPPTDYVYRRVSLYRFKPLPIQISHAAHVYELPPHHNDPFDRMLVAQSQMESIPVITKDEYILRYELKTIW